MNRTDEDSEREEHFKQLRWALQGLALSGSEQPLLFPDYAPSAVNLATDFDHWSAVVRMNHGSDLSSAQSEALAAIDARLAGMSRDGARFDVEIWTDAALARSDDWSDVRRLAAAALDAFEWPVEAPSRPSELPVE
jgi:hypothetical protein